MLRSCKNKLVPRLALFAALAFTGFGLRGAAETEVVIREWDVPTPNSHPHDPAVAPDGALWYTGQFANTLGRLDPKTGQVREYSLRTPASGPHGLVADRDGNIWFTANSAAYIGKLVPDTGEITEYPMRGRATHTPRSSTPKGPSGSRCKGETSWASSTRGPARSP